MRTRFAISVLTIVLVLGGAGLRETAIAHAGEEPAKALGLDPARPETWEPAIAALRKREDRLAEALIAVAEDEKRTADDRRKAIAVLGDLRNARALDFLVAHVALELPLPPGEEKEDRLHRTPCAYALAEGRDWRAAQAIVCGLYEKRLAPRDLMLLAHVLERILGKDLAVAAVDYRLLQLPASSAHGLEHKCLTGLKTYLEHERP